MGEEERQTIYSKLIVAQSNMGQPILDSIGRVGRNGERQYKYASLSSVLAVVRPALNAAGLFLTQRIVDDIYMETRVYDEYNSLLLDRRKMKLVEIPQQDGSTETYAKRYALCSVFGLSGVEDDDGASASDDKQPTKLNKVEAAVQASMEMHKERKELFAKLCKEVKEAGIKVESWFKVKGLAGKKVDEYTDAELNMANSYLQGLLNDKKALESGASAAGTTQENSKQEVVGKKVAVCRTCGNLLEDITADALPLDLNNSVECCELPDYELRSENGK